MVEDGGGDVEGEAADAGALGFLAGGLQGAGAVVAFALGLVAAGAFSPGAADLPGGDLGFDLRCGLLGGVGLVQPGRPARERARVRAGGPGPAVRRPGAVPRATPR